MQNYNLIKGVHSADSEECVRRGRGRARARACHARAGVYMIMIHVGCRIPARTYAENRRRTCVPVVRLLGSWPGVATRELAHCVAPRGAWAVFLPGGRDVAVSMVPR
eukprot:COSAG02_NODE_458_length_21942_cov_1643.812068_24_plen_107_part_00